MPTKSQIRKMAVDLLIKNNVSSLPVDVEKIAIDRGADVKRVDMKEDISGFSYGNTIGVNLRNALVRQRFTIAHELGHMLLHAKDLHYDGKFVEFRNSVSSSGLDPREAAANLFAAELLMPRKFIEQELEHLFALDVEDDDAIDSLAENFEVSRQAMTVRLVNLGFLGAS